MGDLTMACGFFTFILLSQTLNLISYPCWWFFLLLENKKALLLLHRGAGNR